MICFHCGFSNDDQATCCGQCRSQLSLQPDADPAPEITQRSSSMAFQEQILNQRFKIIKSLGKGGMGEIYLAEDNKLKRKVAIKSIGADSICDGGSKTRFLREAQAASQLDHGNICTIYEIAEEGEREYIIMQYVDGVTLDQLQKMKPLSLNKIIDISLQIADGMMEAHAQNIIHRDIKPANIMIDKSGKVKILDFGLAKICPGKKANGANSCPEPDLTEKGIVMGTVSYMSPEQAKGQELDRRSDIFSFGVVLHELLERKNPFANQENIVTLYNILHKEITFSEHVPAGLQKIAAKILQKDRNQRYNDFGEIKNDLTALRAELEIKRITEVRTETEIIDAHEQKKLLQEVDRLQKSSDDENLSEMVKRLKRLKASTEAIPAYRSKKLWLGLAALGCLALLLAVALQRFIKPAPGAKEKNASFFNILLLPFENQSPENMTAAGIHYLLQESLNQFENFKILDEKIVPDFSGAEKVDARQLAVLQQKYRIQYLLRIKLSNIADKFNIEADFSKVGSREAHAPFFFPGKEKNSLLTDQVDNLTRRVQQIVFAGQPAADRPLYRIAGMYGKDWQAFEIFFRGLTQWNKKQFGAARQHLVNAANFSGALPMAEYYLAMLADYTGANSEAVKYLKKVLPKLQEFSRPWQLKILALQAKFDFNFKEQIDHLQELKAFFPYHKETFYELGEAYFRCGNAQQAIPEFQAALALDNNYADALNHLGYCYSYLGRHLQAIECFEKYRDIDRTANSFDSLGDGYFYKGDYTQAENNKIYAASLDSSMDWPYLTIADIHILKDNDAEAEKNLQVYEKKAGYVKAKADALGKKAFIRYRNQDYPAAMALLNQAIQKHDSTVIGENSSEYHWLKGLCCIAGNDLPGARHEAQWLQSLRDKYRLSAENFNAAWKYTLHLQALIAEREKQPQQAEKLFKELLAAKSQLSFWITHYNYQFFLSEYSEFLLRQNNFNAVDMTIRQCLEFNPDYPPALWTKVALLKATKNRDYREVLKKIAEIYGPGDGKNIWRNRLKAERL